MFEKLKEGLKKPTAEWIQEVADENEKLRAENARMKLLLQKAEKIIMNSSADDGDVFDSQQQWLGEFSELRELGYLGQIK